ncbi:hypothetical protein B0H66DRAFT_560579 [Apodospora peruviana]|uniref:Formamidopyrimidine-DNA glycosylase catalytic domain-containing protein n=1 Tax=Apodospora peruviana TaxID=516989 RepID=A0AAE0M337_9PEZI|nr:hypothetical protein B0H66DRAFT_560579 [Apodospora peruviana]
MPEIAEIARAVHFFRVYLVGKTIKHATAIEDANVFGKAGTTGPEFAAAMTGKKVLSAGSQGKYFWLVLDIPPHPVFHFGMTGWVHIKGDRTAYTNYYKKMKPEELDMWPPKFWKFQLKTDDDSPVEVAFTDPRRFGRVRLVDCPGESIRQHSPLVENGPDPVVDTDIFTEEFLKNKMRSRHVPVKALLLDQAFISGIGNWVGDEVLYHAKLHPEQYCDEFNDDQITDLYKSIRYVCQLAVDKLGDSDQFPEHWLFNYRWGKGKKGAAGALPNGEKLAFLTVGGRTSCYAPNIQKKTGRVVPGVEEEPLGADIGARPKKASKTKLSKGVKIEPVESEEEESKSKKSSKQKVDKAAKAVKKEAPAPKNKRKAEEAEEEEAEEEKPKPAKKGKTSSTKKGAVANGGDLEEGKTTESMAARRRSGRLQAK